MKLLIEQSLDCREPEIRIVCGLMDERLKRLIEQIKTYCFSVTAWREADGIPFPVALEEIFYFESVDNKTFVYCENQVLRCGQKLYELEELLEATSFLRISKNCILNSSVVVSVSAQLSGRVEALLTNGEKVLISKHYAQAFRNKFSL